MACTWTTFPSHILQQNSPHSLTSGSTIQSTVSISTVFNLQESDNSNLMWYDTASFGTSQHIWFFSINAVRIWNLAYIYVCIITSYMYNFFFLWLDSPVWAWASSFRQGFMITHLRHATVGRTPLDEGPARRRDLYLTTHNTHKRQTSMPPVRFEPTILVSERPKTHVLDRTATGIDSSKSLPIHNLSVILSFLKYWNYYKMNYWKILKYVWTYFTINTHDTL
jgi:hypothetical protein